MKYEFIRSALKCVAIFTEKVIFPYLNLAEIGTQQNFVDILPKLYSDLQKGEMDTLAQYQVQYSFQFDSHLSKVDDAILMRFCKYVAKALEIARGREYGFSEEGRNERGTRVNILTSEQLANLPTNNILSERELAAFDLQVKKFARATNHHFKANGKYIRIMRNSNYINKNQA